ncbi:hypothetical protein E4U19_003088 [Claviceps sp. Clav32 group G5]|nr:hypothetical protein E4U19_003088 [Claviceps sp. Clav32 group G5]
MDRHHRRAVSNLCGSSLLGPYRYCPSPPADFLTVPTRRDGSYRPIFVMSVARSFQFKLRSTAESRNQYVNGSVPLPREAPASSALWLAIILDPVAGLSSSWLLLARSVLTH